MRGVGHDHDQCGGLEDGRGHQGARAGAGQGECDAMAGDQHGQNRQQPQPESGESQPRIAQYERRRSDGDAFDLPPFGPFFRILRLRRERQRDVIQPNRRAAQQAADEPDGGGGGGNGQQQAPANLGHDGLTEGIGRHDDDPGPEQGQALRRVRRCHDLFPQMRHRRVHPEQDLRAHAVGFERACVRLHGRDGRRRRHCRGRWRRRLGPHDGSQRRFERGALLGVVQYVERGLGLVGCDRRGGRGDWRRGLGRVRRGGKAGQHRESDEQQQKQTNHRIGPGTGVRAGSNIRYRRGMHLFLNILVGLVLLGVLGVLAAGMIGLARGDLDPRRSNKLMQWRVMVQGAALILIVILMSLLRG